MEHGFEIILCDFRDVQVISVLEAEQASWFGDRWMLDADWLNFLQAVTSRYWGIGGDRVIVDYESFVTAWDYDISLSLSSENPRLTNISKSQAKKILQDITALVLSQKPEQQQKKSKLAIANDPANNALHPTSTPSL